MQYQQRRQMRLSCHGKLEPFTYYIMFNWRLAIMNNKSCHLQFVFHLMLFCMFVLCSYFLHFSEINLNYKNHCRVVSILQLLNLRYYQLVHQRGKKTYDTCTMHTRSHWRQFRKVHHSKVLSLIHTPVRDIITCQQVMIKY